MIEDKLRKFIPKKQYAPRKVKVCFYSNAPGMKTGYAVVVREVASRLARDPNYDVHVIGENYQGQPGPMLGFTVWPMGPSTRFEKQETFIDGCVETLAQIKPDVLILLEDSFTLANQQWHNWVLKYGKPLPLIFYIPLDGEFIPTNGIPICRLSDKLVAMADFTANCLKKEGFDSTTIWHGIDLFKNSPVNKEKQKELKKKYGFPEDCFLIFNYARNNYRKQNPRMAYCLYEYLKDKDPNKYKAFLNIMHYKTIDGDVEDVFKRNIVLDHGIDLLQTGHVVLNPRTKDMNTAPSDEEITEYIQMADVIVSATSGEGSGLICPHSMACAKPVVHTDYTTAYEWLIEEKDGIGPRGIAVPYDATVVGGFNTRHAFVSIEKFAEAIDYLEKHPEVREQMGKNGRKFVEKFANWDYITQQWHSVIQETIN